MTEGWAISWPNTGFIGLFINWIKTSRTAAAYYK